MRSDAPAVRLPPPGADLADAFAQDLIAASRGALPDLTQTIILLPSGAGAARLRALLAKHAGRGLLGPRISTLGSFAAQQPGPAPLSALECRLLLTEALRRYRNLFPGQDNAQVAEALFELFEELTAAQVVPDADEAAFVETLGKAYDAPSASPGVISSSQRRRDGAPKLEWLSREAQIVHKLWQAFAADSGARSPATVHLAKLRAAFEAATTPNQTIHLVGFDAFTPGEAAIVGAALRAGRAQLWLQGRAEGHDGVALVALAKSLGIELPEAKPSATPRAVLLDAAFGHPRANGNPVLGGLGLSTVEAAGAEHEARCVDLAVRRALLAGKRDIAVLTQDRRLARRLRALLERARVPLQDDGGWALSTSRAAAALDAWLECVEGRFRFRPLLDLLKSGYVEAEPTALDALERALIYGKGIDGGLDALLGAAQSEALQSLLKKLKDAAFSVPRRDSGRPAQKWTQALLRSLDSVGLAARFADDAAGEGLARVLVQLDAAFTRVPLELRWDEFRAVLDGAVERATFSPESGASPVRLVTLETAQSLRCELLIVAGATREQLPGHAPREPFFSQPVRSELGLASFQERQSLALARLRNALDSASEVIVTWSAGTEDEPAQASPWIEAIESQAARADIPLRDTLLPPLAASAAADIGDDSAGPALPITRPAPTASSALMPDKLSATAHQALLDCPYRFFARSMLKLEDEHAPDEDPDRSDYGKRVHKILEAFAQPVAGYPPPFTERIGAGNRERAQQRLTEISDAVFAPDLAQRALALTWKAEFRAAIPELLDWMSDRPMLRDVRAEAVLEQTLEGVRLHGIVDRLETRTNGTRVVVDYKTGRKLPTGADIEAGEAVQLIHYALLDDKVAAVEYRQLRKDSDSLEVEQDLPTLRAQVRDRLAASIKAMRAGAKLPAQGIETVCEHCEFGGLCRREDWHG